MRRLLLLLLASGAIASSNFVPDPGGQPGNRFNTLFTLAQNRQHYRSLSSTDSATQSARAWPGEMWLHERNRMYFINWKANDGTILSGNPQWWNEAYGWGNHATPGYITGPTDATLIETGNTLRADSTKWYLHFLTDATNASLTRSGLGTVASPWTIGLNLGNANSWTARQTFKSIQSDSVLFKATGGAGIITIKARTILDAGESYTMFLPMSAGTSGEFLGAFGSGITGWTSAVTNVTTGEGLKRTISGVTYTVGINYANSNTWTATQTFPKIVTDTALVKSATCNVQMIAPTTEPGTNVALTLPPDDGDASEFLQTNGSGVMTWEPEADGVIGNEVTGAAADSIIKRTGSGTALSPYSLRIDTTRAITWKGIQTHDSTIVALDGVDFPVVDYSPDVPTAPTDADCNTAFPGAVVGFTGYLRDVNDSKVYMVFKYATDDWRYIGLSSCL